MKKTCKECNLIKDCPLRKMKKKLKENSVNSPFDKQITGCDVRKATEANNRDKKWREKTRERKLERKMNRE